MNANITFPSIPDLLDECSSSDDSSSDESLIVRLAGLARSNPTRLDRTLYESMWAWCKYVP